ncbi:MAG: diguanylate cyclase [Sulfuricurvum sp.]|nr:diguanylate cyclase [Sulfuricurvum sp.]
MESLKLKSKLLYLLLTVGFSLLAVGLIGYFNIRAVNNHIETLYNGSLLPLNELHAIDETYYHELSLTVYRWNNHLIDDEQAAQNITQGLDHVAQMWKNYIAYEKRSDEMAYVSYSESQINAMERYFLSVRDFILSSDRSHPLSLETLSENIDAIHDTIYRLIIYENASAAYEHSIVKTQYKNTLMQLCVLLLAIVILVMGLAWKIFIRIEWQQRQLLTSTETLQHLNLKLEQASYTDSLTSIYNRRYFNLLYDREYKRSIRSGRAFVFMMLDIDYFKQYNDTYGHIQGDQALQAVAKVLKSTLQRPGDWGFRLGGEEFGIILTDTECDSSRQMGEKIRAAIEGLKIEHKGSKVAPILTVSIGAICIIPLPNMGDEALIHAADTNLYAAKERGRNRVVFTTSINA